MKGNLQIALLMNRSRCSPSFRFEEQSLSRKTQGMKLLSSIITLCQTRATIVPLLTTKLLLTQPLMVIRQNATCRWCTWSRSGSPAFVCAKITRIFIGCLHDIKVRKHHAWSRLERRRKEDDDFWDASSGRRGIGNLWCRFFEGNCAWKRRRHVKMQVIYRASEF